MTKSLVIDLQLWARGGRETYLLNLDGTMCCLGFLGQACGVSKEKLLGRAQPAAMDDPDGWPEGICDVTSSWTAEAIRINDDIIDGETLTDEQRQDKIKQHFKLIGYEVSFSNPGDPDLQRLSDDGG